MSPDTPEHLPEHVAVIMDGNGRWAQQRGLPRIKGHEQGAESVRALVQACSDHGIRYLTLYAFSVENWSRPKDEVTGLMRMLEQSLRKYGHELHKHKVRLRVIGRLDDLPGKVRAGLEKTMRETADYTEGTVTFALSYGGRAELVDAARAVAREVQAGRLDPEQIDEAVLSAHLYAPDLPDPDLMIRTSGECRISNFLLWQLSYAELYFTETLWPDFREKDFQKALDTYAGRHRRFGGV